MATTEEQVMIRGTLRADGTIELSERPDLPAGPVEVTIRRASVPHAGWWEALKAIRAEREAAGHRFLTDEEIQAEIADMRKDDGRMDRIYREIEEARERESPDAC